MRRKLKKLHEASPVFSATENLRAGSVPVWDRAALDPMVALIPDRVSFGSSWLSDQRHVDIKASHVQQCSDFASLYLEVIAWLICTMVIWKSSVEVQPITLSGRFFGVDHVIYYRLFGIHISSYSIQLMPLKVV